MSHNTSAMLVGTLNFTNLDPASQIQAAARDLLIEQASDGTWNLTFMQVDEERGEVTASSAVRLTREAGALLRAMIVNPGHSTPATALGVTQEAPVSVPETKPKPETTQDRLPDTMSLRELAERLDLNLTYAYELAQADKLPVPALKVGRQYRFNRATYDAWLNTPKKE